MNPWSNIRILLMIIIISVFVAILTQINNVNAETKPTREEVIKEIAYQAYEAGISVDAALRIAQCESNFDPYAKNPHSSAKGIFQFIDGTWKWIGAEGHQFDYKENIKQFTIWYLYYPTWWVCK